MVACGGLRVSAWWWVTAWGELSLRVVDVTAKPKAVGSKATLKVPSMPSLEQRELLGELTRSKKETKKSCAFA